MFSRSRRGLRCLSWRRLVAGRPSLASCGLSTVPPRVSSSMQTCSQRRVRSSWVGWRFHKHSDRLCLSAISVGPSGYGAAPHVNLSAGSAQRKRRAVTGTLRTSMAPVAGPFFRPGRAVAARLINRYSLMHMFGMCCHRLSFPAGASLRDTAGKCAALARLLVATMETRFDFHYTRRIAGQFQLVIEIDTRK